MFKHAHIRAVSMDYVARPDWSAYWINAENSAVVISVSNNIRTRRIETYWKHDDQASKFYQGGESTKENEGIYIIFLHYNLICVVPFQFTVVIIFSYMISQRQILPSNNRTT